VTERIFRNIRLQNSETLTWLILDRQDKANALSVELLEEFSAALDMLKTEGAPVIAIRGEGRGFSSGYDIGAVGGYGAPNPIADHERLQNNIRRYLAIWDHPKPVIAAVHGYCMGGATQICVYADITIVAHDSRIGEPTVPIGGGYIAPLWVPLVGAKRAKEFSFVPGNSIDGRTAVEWGWANHSVSAEELVEIVEDLARRIAKTPPEVLRVKKQSINRAAEAAGHREVSASVSEMNALLHMAPSVVELRRWIGEVGLKQAIEAFRVEPSSPLTLPQIKKSVE
jgi:enoyl-CoA hydratase